jgi:Nucleotide-diphospho-sugar transferase
VRLEHHRGYDSTLCIGVLSVAQFCNGHTFFVQRMPQRLGLKPYVVHCTFQFGYTEGKQERMREFQLWNVRLCCLSGCFSSQVSVPCGAVVGGEILRLQSMREHDAFWQPSWKWGLYLTLLGGFACWGWSFCCCFVE